MILRPPRSTRTHTRCPYTTLCRSGAHRGHVLAGDRAEHGGVKGGRILPPRRDQLHQSRIANARLGAGIDDDVDAAAVDAGVGEDQAAGAVARGDDDRVAIRSEEHTSELPSLMRTSYAVFCLKKKTTSNN